MKFETISKENRYNKTTLENGIRVLSEYLPDSESYALGMCVKAGARDDFKGVAGIAHFLEHIIFKGSKKLSARKIATSFESLGAYTNAFTTQENTLFYVRALNPHFDKTFSMLSDIVLHPEMKSRDIEKEKSVIIEEIKSYEDDPEEQIFDFADNMIFGEHPLGTPIVGTVDSISQINSELLREYHQTYFQPSNLIVVASGAITHNHILKLANKYLKYSNEPKNIPSRLAPEIVEPSELTVSKQIQQTHLVYAKRIEGIKSVERYPMSVLNVLLGDGMSSRLYQNVREKSGLAYSVYSSIQLFEDCGGFYIYSATDSRNEKKLKQSLLKEIINLRINTVKESELNRAKEQLKSSVIMEMESKSSRIQSLVKNEFQLGYYEDSTATINAINAVCLDDIKLLADKYFNEENWNLVTIKPD